MQQSTGENRLIDEALALIEARGGIVAMRERMAARQIIWDRMRREQDALTREYPDKWAAMGKDGLVAVGDSLDHILERVDALGVPRSDVVLEFLEADPVPLIL